MRVFYLMLTHRFFLLLLVSVTFFSCKSGNASFEEEANANDSLVVVVEMPNKKDYTMYEFSQKSQVVADAKKEFEAFKLQLSNLKLALKADSNNIASDKKLSYESAIKETEKSQSEYQKKIAALEKSNAENWESVKTDIANAYNTLKQNIANVSDVADNKSSTKNDSVNTAKKTK